MALIDFLQSNEPPSALVQWALQRLGVDPLDETDPGLRFAVVISAAFIHWIKREDGLSWIFSVNGVKRQSLGPWDIIVIKDGLRRRNIKSEHVFAWDREKPVFKNGPIPGAANSIRGVLRTFQVGIPESVVVAIQLPPDTKQGEFQAKVALLSSMLLAGWFNTEDGHFWAFHQFEVLQAITERRERVYSERLNVIGADYVVEHTRKAATAYCEECGTLQPCVVEERLGAMCRRCHGYTSMNSSSHSVCAACDISDCPHWLEFSGAASDDYNQAWLLSEVR